MRTSQLFSLSCGAALVAALAFVPARASAQLNIDVKFGTHLGPEVGVFAYSPDRLGDWRANFRKWTPVTLYDVNGHYYHHPVRGARAVMVYSYNGQYFFPPSDHAWVGFDTRYDYHHAPLEVDFGRVRPYEAPVVVPPAFGDEIGVFGYAAARTGDWRRDWRRWTPVTVYEWRGHYYPRPGPGARPVEIYRYHDEYFLPPADRAWVGFDKRFDYAHAPTDEDRRRVRERP